VMDIMLSAWSSHVDGAAVARDSKYLHTCTILPHEDMPAEYVEFREQAGESGYTRLVDRLLGDRSDEGLVTLQQFVALQRCNTLLDALGRKDHESANAALKHLYGMHIKEDAEQPIGAPGAKRHPGLPLFKMQVLRNSIGKNVDSIGKNIDWDDV